MYEKKISIFNRGYIGLVLQLHEHHTWVMTEIERNTGTFFRIGGDIRNLYRSYNLEMATWFCSTSLSTFSMAINQHTYAAIHVRRGYNLGPWTGRLQRPAHERSGQCCDPFTAQRIQDHKQQENSGREQLRMLYMRITILGPRGTMHFRDTVEILYSKEAC